MANNYIGVGILWGFPGGPACTMSGLAVTTTNVQSLDYSSKAKSEQIPDGTGNTAGIVYYDHEEAVSFDFIVQSSTASGTYTVTGVPSAGQYVTVTDANQSNLSKTWILEEFTATRSNVKNMVAKVSLRRFINNAGSNGMPA